MSMIYSLLSHSWGGLVIAALVAGVGLLLARVGRWRIVRWVGFAVCALALLLAAGSVVAIVRIARANRAYPPPGRLVDVGGQRMHIWAEGDARGGPTVIWIPGGHSQGLGLYHLHKAMRGETRSILFDRFGTGWSDAGPFPRSTAREAEELNTLLDNAGEKGPFILAGHSYGGLLAANFARRHPDKTAALVLLDPTPPDAFVYAPVFGMAAAKGLILAGQLGGLQKLFGFQPDSNRGAAADPELAKLLKQIDDSRADVREMMDSRNASPAQDFALASIFNEWFDPASPPQFMVYDGELGEMPVYLVTPQGDTEPQIRRMRLSDAETKRAINFFQRARVRYLATSSKSEHIVTPAGTGHNYPYEVPQFLIETMRHVLAKSRAPQTAAAK